MECIVIYWTNDGSNSTLNSCGEYDCDLHRAHGQKAALFTFLNTYKGERCTTTKWNINFFVQGITEIPQGHI